MWLYFNEKGQLLESSEYDGHARSGTTNFEIFAVFKNININVTYSNATIKLIKPDLDKTEYPLLLMRRVKKTFRGEDGNFFKKNEEYEGYSFDFADFDDEEDEQVLLDMPGLWEAVITIIGANRELNVQGMVTFNVGNGFYTGDAKTISKDELLNNIYMNMAMKLPIKSSSYIHVVPDISIYALDNFPSAVFSAGDIVLDAKTEILYKLVTLRYEDKEQLVIDSSRLFRHNITVSDNTGYNNVVLSITSRKSNPINSINELLKIYGDVDQLLCLPCTTLYSNEAVVSCFTCLRVVNEEYLMSGKTTTLLSYSWSINSISDDIEEVFY